jgi:hypothetical protein
MIPQQCGATSGGATLRLQVEKPELGRKSAHPPSAVTHKVLSTGSAEVPLG